MGGIRRVVVGFFALACIAGLGVAVQPVRADVADAPIVSRQTIQLTVTGPSGGVRGGVASGREPIKISKGQAGVTSLRGAAEFSGASVVVDASALLGFIPLYFGTVRHDLGSGVVNTPVIFGRVGAVTAAPDEEAYRLQTTWFDFSSFPWSRYSIELEVENRLASPQALCLQQRKNAEVALEAYHARMGVYPGGADDQVMPAGPVAQRDADAMLARLLRDAPDYAGAHTASIRLLKFAPLAATRDDGVQVSVPPSGTDIPFVTISMAGSGSSIAATVEGWGSFRGTVVSCAELPGVGVVTPASCQATAKAVQVALEAYNAHQGTYPGGTADALPPAGPVSEADADAIISRLIVNEVAQPGKPWTAKLRFLGSAPLAATLDNSGGGGQVSLPDGLTLEQFNGVFVALEYAPAPFAEMTAYGYFTEADGASKRLEHCN